MSIHLPRRRRALTLSALVVASIAGAGLLAFHTGSAQAAPAGKAGSQLTVTRLTSTSGRTVPAGVQLNLANFACANMTDLPVPQGCDAPGADASNAPNGPGLLPNAPFHGASTTHGKGSPNVPSTGRAGAGNLLTNINGLNDDSNIPLIGGHVTPPDQALCVGPASSLEAAGLPLGVPSGTSVVLEGVNETWAVYSTSGTLLYGPDSLADLFNDPYASGDIGCNYDPATNAWFFTEIGVLLSGPDIYNYGTDLAVIGPGGWVPYQVDTSVNTNCFPDFPQQGYDNNAFYLTINEFCGAAQDFAGANLYALSKSQLASLSSSVNGVVWGPLADQDGIPVLGLRPATGDGTSTEYLLNSVPYGADGYGTNASSLGFWQVTNDQSITSGSGVASLAGRSISTEGYAFPVNAASTGDGSCQDYVNLHGVDEGCVVTRESYLDPVDTRLLQVQYANVGGATRLYTSLDTALTVGSDPTPVDGAAWFDINPNTGKVNHQGYVGLAGTNLLFPSMMRSNSGTLMMGFSMTSPTLNPSTGYVVSKNEGNAFSPVQTTGVGSGWHISYSPILFGRHRWGDYSAVALDPASGNVWMADEYIPPADQGGSDPADNWGTRVWSLTG